MPPSANDPALPSATDPQVGGSRGGVVGTPPLLKVIVVGGGIAGLAAAHRLVERCRELGRPLALTLCEAAGRLGGTIRTERSGEGFLIEAGPDSFISEKPWALALVERIGLGPRLRLTDDRYRRTYVARGRRLYPLPDGFLLLAPVRIAPFVASPLFSWRGKLRMALDLVLPRRHGDDDESLASFVTRRLGREALERVAEPLVAGIYTAVPERLSLAATMPRFLALERQHRSLILGLRRSVAAREAQGASGPRWSLFVTLAGGMGELVEALAARLPVGSVRLSAAVAAVTAGNGAERWQVRLDDGTVLPADGVILAGEAPRMAPILRERDPELARLLAGIRYASSATVTFGYPRAAIRHPLDGFGFVVPRSEGRAVLACTFASVKYSARAPEGSALLRAFLGGARADAILEHDDAGLARLAEGELAGLLGIEGAPSLTRVARQPAAMPQYDVGHLGRVAAMEARLTGWPGVALAGSAYRGVGIPDCIRSGEDAAGRVLEILAPRGA
jgi:oxygen-dependent protoporphyrinogen oxidase